MYGKKVKGSAGLDVYLHDKEGADEDSFIMTMSRLPVIYPTLIYEGCSKNSAICSIPSHMTFEL